VKKPTRKQLQLDKLLGSITLWFVLAVVLFAVAVTVKLVGVDATRQIQEQVNALTIDLLLSIIVSFVFYYLVVHLPEKRRRNRIRNNFLNTYLAIKEGLLWQIVFGSIHAGRHDLNTSSEQVELLKDVKSFRATFSGGKEAHEGWYAFSNHMTNDTPEFREILLLLSQLRMHVEYVLFQDVFEDQELLDFFTRLRRHLLRLERTDASDYEKRPLISFLYELLSGWNFIEGYRDFDLIEKEASKVV
jgi:hypothetical protein